MIRLDHALIHTFCSCCYRQRPAAPVCAAGAVGRPLSIGGVPVNVTRAGSEATRLSIELALTGAGAGPGRRG